MIKAIFHLSTDQQLQPLLKGTNVSNDFKNVSRLGCKGLLWLTLGDFCGKASFYLYALFGRTVTNPWPDISADIFVHQMPVCKCISCKFAEHSGFGCGGRFDGA